MAERPINRDEKSIQTYVAVCRGFMGGIIRLIKAEYAFHCMMNALTNYRIRNPKYEGDDSEIAEIHALLNKTTIDEFWAAEYVTCVTDLIYATSLFDTFVNETTIFLFLLIPDALGETHTVALRSLLDGNSPTSILTEIAKTRAREISFKSFLERLEILKKKFGLPFALSDTVKSDLEKYSELRNRAVHDQGFLALSLDGSGHVAYSSRASEDFPTEITFDEADKAQRVYQYVALTVAKDVLEHVLKTDLSCMGENPAAYVRKKLASEPA